MRSNIRSIRKERDDWWLGTHVEKSRRIPGKHVFDPRFVKPVEESQGDGQLVEHPRYTSHLTDSTEALA